MKVSIYVEKTGGPAYEIENSGDQLVYRYSQDGSTDPWAMEKSLDPSGDRWREFWEFARTCQHWRHEYVGPKTPEAVGWEVELKHDELHIISCGIGEFPTEWDTFLDHVTRLAG